MKKLVIKKFLPIILLIIVGNGLIVYSAMKIKAETLPYELHQKAEKAWNLGDPSTAYILYVESSIAFSDPHLKAIALCDAATVGWTTRIADFNALVNLYQQALRYDPGNYEASFNLEYLYYMKENPSDSLPELPEGDKPTRDDEAPSGDV